MTSGAGEGPAASAVWAGRADALQGTLAGRFWDPRRGLYAVRSDARLRRLGQWHYWWQAHALHATVEAYLRRPAAELADRCRAHLAGIVQRSRDVVRNDYFDDMGWLGLAVQAGGSAGALPAARADELVERLVAEIALGVGPQCGGGVSWARGHLGFKNVPATGPYAILLAQRAVHSGRGHLLVTARELVDWMARTLVQDGVVWDGAREQPDGSVELVRSEYTYDYGLVVGADLAVGTAAGDRALLERARTVAGVALQRMTDPATGVWRAEGGGDGGLFKGVLARYLGGLATHDLDSDLAAALGAQGAAVWASCGGEHGDGGLVGGDWSRPAPAAVDLSEHLSGVLLLEQCAALEAAGLLRDGGSDGAPVRGGGGSAR